MAEQQTTTYPGPELVSEAEVLLGTDTFYDEERLDFINGGDFGEINPEELGVRSILYTHLLRLIARERHRDRQAEAPFDVTPGEWNDQWQRTHLTYKRLAELAITNAPELSALQRQLAIINNIERFMDEERSRPADDTAPQLYPDQADIVAQIARFFQAEPPKPIRQEYVEAFDLTRVRFTKGATVEAPTGSGKTVVMGRTIAMCGIGQTPEGAKQPLRALLIVPTQDLVEQLSGKTGDDTLRNWAPGVTFGAYYQHEKENLADVVVASKAQFLRGCRNGLFFGEELDQLLVDETHLVTEPEFLRVLTEHWDRPVIGFTATPDYTPSKDARRVLPYVIKAHKDGDNALLEYTERGRLNGAELYTYMFDARQHPELFEGVDLSDPTAYKKACRSILDKMALDFVVNQVQEGRRGIMFCEPGGVGRHAKTLAARLNGLGLMVPDGEGGERPLAAKAIGWFLGPHNRRVINAYHQGKVDVLFTTEKGREGLNGRFDFVGIDVNINSFLKYRQIVGRGTRKSEEFPFTRYAEFVTPGFKYSLCHVFGLERVQQGAAVGGGLPADEGLRRTMVRRTPLDPALQDLCMDINGKLLSEISVGPAAPVEIPPDYVNGGAIAEQIGLPESYVVRRLRQQGYIHLGRWERPAGQRQFKWYFEPNAVTYFQDNPIPPLAAPDMKNLTQVVSDFGMDGSTLKRLARLNGITVKLRLSPTTHLRGRYFTAEDLETLQGYLDTVPVASPNDVPISVIRQELGLSDPTILRMLDQGKRAPILMDRSAGDWAGPRFVSHVLAEDAVWLRREFNRIPYADPQAELHQHAITERAGGVQSKTIMNHATPAELARGVERRKPGRESSSNRIYTYWPVELVDAWIRRYQAQRSAVPLAGPGDRTTPQLAQELGFRSHTSIYTLIKKHAIQPVAMRSADGRLGDDRDIMPHIRAADVERLRALRAAVPPAGPDDLPVSVIAEEFGLGHRYIQQLLHEAGKDTVPMLRMQGKTERGAQTIPHIQAADVAWLRAAIAAIPLAGPGDLPIGVLIEEYGVRPRVFYTLLARDGRSAITMRRRNGDPYIGKGRPQIGTHVQRADVEWLRTQLRPGR